MYEYMLSYVGMYQELRGNTEACVWLRRANPGLMLSGIVYVHVLLAICKVQVYLRYTGNIRYSGWSGNYLGVEMALYSSPDVHPAGRLTMRH